MSETFFISDTHWGHANVILYSSRPFSDVADMNEKLIENWNDIVKPGDLVYHLGDFAFLKVDEIRKLCKRLNGSIHLCLGNHDKEIRKHKNELQNSAFASIQDYKEISHDKNKIILFHYSLRVWNRSHHNSIACFGHSHGSLPPHGKSVDVGVDAKWITEEYRPIHLDELLKFMSNREVAIVDGHKERTNKVEDNQ